MARRVGSASAAKVALSGSLIDVTKWLINLLVLYDAGERLSMGKFGDSCGGGPSGVSMLAHGAASSREKSHRFSTIFQP